MQTAVESNVKAEGRELFESFEQAELRVVQRSFRAGETILVPGDPDDRLYFVLSGDLRTYKTYNPYREATTGLLKDGGIFGKPGLSRLQPGTPPSTQEEHAEALTEVRVASVSKADIASAIERSPELAGVLFSALATQIRRSDACIYTLLPREVASRLALLLLSLVERFANADGSADDGEGAANGTVVEFRLTHQQLSEMIASTREAVSKAMVEFQRTGLIEVLSKSKKIRVLSQEGLLLRTTGMGP